MLQINGFHIKLYLYCLSYGFNYDVFRRIWMKLFAKLLVHMWYFPKGNKAYYATFCSIFLYMKYFCIFVILWCMYIYICISANQDETLRSYVVFSFFFMRGIWVPLSKAYYATFCNLQYISVYMKYFCIFVYVEMG